MQYTTDARVQIKVPAAPRVVFTTCWKISKISGMVENVLKY